MWRSRADEVAVVIAIATAAVTVAVAYGSRAADNGRSTGRAPGDTGNAPRRQRTADARIGLGDQAGGLRQREIVVDEQAKGAGCGGQCPS